MRTPARWTETQPAPTATAKHRPHHGLKPWLIAALTLLALLGLARPVSAEAPAIFGIQNGERLDGPAILWAEARGPSHWMTLHLRGPATNLEARGTNRRVHLRETASTGAPLPWDASKARPGTYTLTATSFFRGRSWDRNTVTFTVGGTPAATASAADEDVTQSAPQPTPQAQTAQLSPGLPEARFANPPAALIENAGGNVPFQLTGPLPAGADILVLAWDHDRRTMVDAFAHTLDGPPYVLDRTKIAALPQGNLELQLHVRGDGQFRQTDTHDVTVNAPTAAPEAGAEALPNVYFPNAGRSYTRGEGRSLRVTVDGDLPENADLLAIAWSLGQGELVERFAHPLRAPGFNIPASRLDRLPQGQNEIQVLVRRDGQVQRKVAVTITMSEPAAEPAPTPTPGNGDSGNNGNTDAPAPQPVVDTPTEPLPDPVVNPGVDEEPTEPDVVVEPPAQPTPGSDLNLQFAPGVPDTYTRGSDATLRVSTGGRLPDNGDILMLAWHQDERQMIGAFAHTLREGDRTIKNGQLDKLPAGRVELQAHLRLSTGTVQVVKQDISIEVPQAAEPEPVADPLPPIAAGPGFTSFPLRSGGRTIYVSSSGSDSNSGLSPNAPLKSPKEGVRKLRDGYPDQLLFKAGDTFRGGLGDWTKSGRDENNKMVVGVYDNGNRPKFYTNGQTFLRVFQRVEHIAFVGLEAYSNYRDPNSSDYRGDRGSPQEDGVNWQGAGRDLHFEDMKFTFFGAGFTFQSSPGNIRDLRIHRCIVAYSWKDKRDGHSSGMYMQGVYDAVITDSIFDHNGWRPGRDTERTQFNHNIYLQKDTKRVTFARGILTRGSHNAIQFRGGGILEDSLLAYNPYGAFVAQEGGIMRRNVVLHGNDMLSSYPLGLGLETLPAEYALIEDNVIAHKRGTAGWIGAIQVSYRNDIIDPPGRYNVTIRRNRVVNYPREYRRESIYETTDRANVTKSRNVMDYASGGNSDPPFVDPTRDIDAYARHIGAGDMEGFLRRAVARERGQWEDRYSAVGANAWIRAGYEYLPYD
ncbi:MAG: hypothetical protein AAGF84_05360 [Planctomycetota bacterium]